MKRCSIGFAACVLVCSLFALASCRRAESPRPDLQTTTIADSAQTPRAPSPDPAPPPSQDSTRASLLQRKGELLMARKGVLASSEMTRAQKDSALQAIEKESVELSKKLLDAGRGRYETHLKR